MELLMEYMARGFVVMLLISMPCVLTAALIGLIVGVLQAVTQVQEQTIAAAPKILGVFLVIIIGGFSFVRLLTNLTTEGLAMAFNIIPKSENYVLPADYYRYTKPFQGEMQDVQSSKKNNDLIKRSSQNSLLNNKEKGMKYYKAPKNQLPKPNLLETQKIMER